MKWLNTYNNILFATIGTISILILLFVAITSLSIFSGSGADNRGIDQEPDQSQRTGHVPAHPILELRRGVPGEMIEPVLALLEIADEELHELAHEGVSPVPEKGFVLRVEVMQPEVVGYPGPASRPEAPLKGARDGSPMGSDRAVGHGPIPAVEITAELLKPREHLKKDVVQRVAQIEMVRRVNRPVTLLQIQSNKNNFCLVTNLSA